MKTTIDIPEPLYKLVKIRAVERGQTLRQLVLSSLQKEIDPEANGEHAGTSPWANRKILPEFARLQAAGAFRRKTGDRDITEVIAAGREDQPL